MELYLEYLVSLLYFVGLDQPFHGQERCLDTVVRDRLLVHVFVDIEVLVLLLQSVGDEAGQGGLQLLSEWLKILLETVGPGFQVQNHTNLFVALRA